VRGATTVDSTITLVERATVAERLSAMRVC
jgi:hypothetical protein